MKDPPTSEELAVILETALQAIEAGNYISVMRRGEPHHFDRDREKLLAVSEYESLDSEDYWGIIMDCLEAAATDPCYCFKQPEEPISTGHHETLGLPLYAFVVKLDDFRKNIYVKFCLKESSDGHTYINIDCHP